MKYLDKNKFLSIITIVIIIIIAVFIWKKLNHRGFGDDFISGNGRIEATEINISTKLGGRIEQIEVHEGDFVQAGQPLVIMQTDTLRAKLSQAQAQHQQAQSNEVNAKSQVALKISDKAASESLVKQRESDLNLALKSLERTSQLAKKGAISIQQLDNDSAKVASARAAVVSAKAQVDAAQAAVEAAQASVQSAVSAIDVALANIRQIQSDIDDSTLTAPVSGRIQYRIAETGEVLGAGGKALSLIDLNDIYLTFFLPETVVGRVAIGDEVRLILDAIPNKTIAAKVSFVSSVAQFTPKTVETKDERQKLMFRVKAKISPVLLNCYLTQVKTGLPGVAWVRLNAATPWPASLSELIQCPEK
ncbi:MAG: HlyD family efflux transporter periplasmic adaptor subunit [Candidatus Schmidhempelia sp.]|nr:HlyD family efflux transporter periplasmic adaptor subunit [Candidatus Schmidhempelia sp.]